MYRYNNWIISRKDKILILENEKNNRKKIIELTETKNSLGQLNIPLSNLCNMNCLYCAEERYNNSCIQTTTTNNAFSLIDIYFEFVKNYKNITTIKLSFDYGGEPTCCSECLLVVSAYFKEKCKNNDKKSIIQMTTNGVCDSRTMKDIIKNIDECIISIDGYKNLHDKYRIYKSGASQFDLIMNNAKAIFSCGKLKQLSSVITYDTIKNVDEYAEFIKENFNGTTIRINPVINIGAAKKNCIKSISHNEWEQFVSQIKKIFDKDVTVIDARPFKDILKKYSYGCENLYMTNWFYWLDGSITCCTNRESEEYMIGKVVDGTASIDRTKIKHLQEINYVEGIEKCSECIAKYYCAGGCPSFRANKIDCERRIKKYASLLITTC